MVSDKKRVALVVDDEDDAREVVATFLTDLGWDVVEGEKGEDAVSKAAQHAVDLVLLDIMMPDKSGFDALRELRDDHRTSHIPVIMLTAVNDYELGANYSAETIGHRAGTRAPEGFLEKPFRHGEIQELIEGIFEED